MYCGDCGGPTRVEGFYRICDACRTRERLPKVSGKMKSGRNIQRFQKTDFTGGGVRGACHCCGNAYGECECE